MNKDQQILELFEDSKTRDRAFSMLIDKYGDRLYWHIRRIVVTHEDSQDILQETLINAFRFIDKFKRDSSLYTWLYRIATNEALKKFRDKKIDTLPMEEMSQIMIERLRAEVDVDADGLAVKFQEAILKLPQKQQLVFNMRYYDELSYEEIAEILDSSIATLKTNYHYANEKIKQYMIN